MNIGWIIFVALAAAGKPSGEDGTDKPTQQKFDLATALSGMKGEKGDLYAVIHTNQGDLVVRLYEKEAPNTVANFVGLARGTREWRDPKTGKWVKRPLYRNVLCHRAMVNYMFQCGDPEGAGTGGPGYTLPDEIVPTLRHNRPGVLSMANRGPNTAGSQFFIIEVPSPHLDDRHAVFGEVVKNLEVVSKITHVKVGEKDRPEQDVSIKSIDVFRSERTPK